MEDKVNIEQNGTSTNIKTTNDIKEVEIYFSQYRVDKIKVVFKNNKEEELEEEKPKLNLLPILHLH